VVSNRPRVVDQTCDRALLTQRPSLAKEDLDTEEGEEVVLHAIEHHSSTARPLNDFHQECRQEDLEVWHWRNLHGDCTQKEILLVMDTLQEDTILWTKASSEAYLTIRFGCSKDSVLHLDIQHRQHFHAVSMELPEPSGGCRAWAEEQSGAVESEGEDDEMNLILEAESSGGEKRTDLCLLKNDRASIEASTWGDGFVFVCLGTRK
jgi:hypothetical protein